ncbi:MAG TPA: bifunctional oligoribonuclease/PAP phosphatase NrnA, partial [Candidatus Latescibacteria bacterium]|nr:bifunctional oligoribonuclease/PAP phosphatase NrnA [Candidatus Latescibacterota bacterium]
RFSNTTSRALHIAGDLVELGVRPDEVADALFHRRSPEAIRRLAEALSSLEFYCGGKVGMISLDDVTSEGTSEDTEGFVDMVLFVDGVEVAAFLRRVDGGSFRVSLRSRGGVPVNKIAGRFGGGGHPRAAGCYVHGDICEAKSRILEAIREAVTGCSGT